MSCHAIPFLHRLELGQRSICMRCEVLDQRFACSSVLLHWGHPMFMKLSRYRTHQAIALSSLPPAPRLAFPLCASTSREIQIFALLCGRDEALLNNSYKHHLEVIESGTVRCSMSVLQLVSGCDRGICRLPRQKGSFLTG